jgi:hypothetical protein
MHDMRPSAPPTPSTSSTAPQGPVPHIGRSLSEPRSLTVMRDDDGLFAAHQYRGGPTVVARGRARSVPGMSALLPGTGTQERVDEPGRGRGSGGVRIGRSASLGTAMEGLITAGTHDGSGEGQSRREEEPVVKKHLGLLGLFEPGPTRRGRGRGDPKGAKGHRAMVH